MEEYFKIRSWHILKFVSRAGWYFAVCGRVSKKLPETASDFPALEKTCESCLRIVRMNEDRLS